MSNANEMFVYISSLTRPKQFRLSKQSIEARVFHKLLLDGKLKIFQEKSKQGEGWEQVLGS